VCIKEEDQITTYDTSSELTDEVEDNSMLDGYTYDESTQEEDVRSYDDLFQSIDVEDPAYLTMYDEGSPSVITPTIDEDSTPYLGYDVDDDEEVIIPQHDGEIEQKPLAIKIWRTDYWSRRIILYRC
jgi:hypothetical protein